MVIVQTIEGYPYCTLRFSTSTNGPTTVFEGTLASETRCLRPVCHYFSAIAWRIPSRELVDTCLSATNRFSKSRLIWSTTRVSLHACASPAPENVVQRNYILFLQLLWTTGGRKAVRRLMYAPSLDDD